MKYDVEELISKCVQGKIAQDILRSIEEELPDANSLRKSLVTDFNRIGIPIKLSDVLVESMCIKVSVSEKIMSARSSDVMSIADTYSRTYPEIEVLVASFCTKP